MCREKISPQRCSKERQFDWPPLGRDYFVWPMVFFFVDLSLLRSAGIDAIWGPTMKTKAFFKVVATQFAYILDRSSSD